MLSSVISGILQSVAWAPHLFIRKVRRLGIYKSRAIALSISNENAHSFVIGGDGLQMLQRFAKDEDLQALVIRISGLPTGWASMQALRTSLDDIRHSGKDIYIHLSTPLRGGLYLGSVATKLWLMPAGFLLWNGVGSRITFYGGLLHKLGLTADIEAAGDYKVVVHILIACSSTRRMDYSTDS